jgi:hypothetical protein
MYKIDKRVKTKAKNIYKHQTIINHSLYRMTIYNIYIYIEQEIDDKKANMMSVLA